MSAPRRSLPSVAVGVVVTLLLAGCGGAGGESSPADGPSGGQWEATLGGHPVELEDASVDCELVEGSMHLRIGDINTDNPSRSTGINAVIAAPEQAPEVMVAQFTLPDGRTLLHSPAKGRGVGMPSTEVTVEGDTYSIEGAGALHDPSGTQATTAFTITVTCA